MIQGSIMRKAGLLAAVAAGATIFSSTLNAEIAVNLTAGGTSTINGAIFTTTDTQSTGTGVIRSFVRISDNSSIVQGYNTDARPLQFDENNSPQFTRSLAKA